MTNVLDLRRTRPPRVAIIGSGFAGLGAAIELRRNGIEDVVILERAGEIGGVWRDNDYPGAACDVQSHVYSFSFLPHPEWRHMFARQGEIQGYLRKVVRDFGLTPYLRLNHRVDDARWDAQRSRWRLRTPAGEIEADHVVVATGALADPVVPDLPGLLEFEGPVFHSARWDHTFDLRGKRVAVIGTGASAIQFVPAIQPLVAQLTLFQRTAPWVLPRHDRPISGVERALYRAVPALQKFQRGRIYLEREATVLGFRNPALMKLTERTARKHLRDQVSDPQLRAKLTPDYRLGCKRVLLSNEYLASLDQPNADLVTDDVDKVTARGIIDGTGREHPVDAIILGTGFHTAALPLTDRIYDGAGRTMTEVWGPSPRAYLGTTVAGFPNIYLMHGPNIALGHNSVVMMFEAQIKYLVGAVRHCIESGAVAVEPTSQAQDRFRDMVDRMTAGSVWTSGGCSSWYLDATGHNSNLWPGTTLSYRWQTRRFEPADHVVHTAATEFVA